MPFFLALVAKEFQTWLRGRLTFALFGGMVLLTSLLVFLLAFFILAPDANAAPALFSTTASTSSNLLISNRALFLFGAVASCVLLAASVVAPAVAASSLALERERGMLDLLLAQGVSGLRLVAGKVVAAVLFSLVALSVAAPLFALAWSFGGVHAEHVGVFLVTLTATTFLFASVGILLGTLVHGSLAAGLLAQAVALFFLFGTLGLYLGVSNLASSDALRPLLWLNPFLALLSGGGSVTETFARQAPAALRASLALPPVAITSTVSAPGWVVSSAVLTALSLAALVAAAVAIDPCHRLRGLPGRTLDRP